MMQPDRMEYIGDSGRTCVQHGPLNDRVYLMKLDGRDLPFVVDDMEALAREKGYSKLFAKVPVFAEKAFLERGFVNEASAPNLYKGTKTGCFMGKYLDDARAVQEDEAVIDSVLSIAESKTPFSTEDVDTSAVISLGPEYAEALSELYRAVFASYPFPVFDPAYIRETMASHVMYFGIVSKGTLVAASSAEIDRDWLCAEMTDFATLPEYRRRGAAMRLLACMEQTVGHRGILSAYTIARAVSTGMNSAFSRAGYTFGGTLTNNTNISGGLESMNVWFKPLVWE